MVNPQWTIQGLPAGALFVGAAARVGRVVLEAPDTEPGYFHYGSRAVNKVDFR